MHHAGLFACPEVSHCHSLSLTKPMVCGHSNSVLYADSDNVNGDLRLCGYLLNMIETINIWKDLKVQTKRSYLRSVIRVQERITPTI